MKPKNTIKHHTLNTLEDLKPSPYNPRKISKEAASGLGYSIDEFGDLSGIVWNSRTGHLVCGHQRLEQLKARNAEYDADEQAVRWNGELFPVRVVDWDKQQEAAANIAANNPHIAGTFTPDLQGLLGNVKLHLGDGFDDLQLDKLVENVPLPVDQDEIPDAPVDPITKPGDVWALGEHRLLCGDCTKDPKFLGGVQVQMVVTDPPYGVSYVGKTKDKLTIQNDDEAGLAVLLSGAFRVARARSAPGCVWYVTAPMGLQFVVFAGALEGIWRQTLVWVKDSMVLGHSDYHYKHEAIFYGWTDGKHTAPPTRSETTVWEIPRPKKSAEHPTMKPVALFARAIQNSSKIGDRVYDPFLGSGTTLVAAEQLGRVCYAVELSPAYCDVTVERWQELTGGKAQRATSTVTK